MQVPDPATIGLLLPIAGMATGVLLVMTLGKTVRHWIDRHYGRRELTDDSGVREQLAQVEQRVAMLEEVADRVQDLEERLDFAERVLTRARERDALPGGKEP